MRKALLALILFCGFPVLAQAATQIVFTWSDTGNAGVPACSATVTTSCLTTFTLTDTTASTVVSSTIPSSTLTFTYTPIGGIPFGYNHTFSLTVSGKDVNGNAVTSSAVSTSISSSILNAPSGFSAVTQ